VKTSDLLRKHGSSEQPLGLGFGEADDHPGTADEDVDLEALGLGDGAILLVELGDEGLEFFAAFGADDLGFGVDAGLQSILGGAGLALGSAGPGGFLGVLVGRGLFFSCHMQ